MPMTPQVLALRRNRVRGFGLIAGGFILLLLITLAASWLAIDIVNSTRAYAAGEGRYSKAQKIAVLALYRFAHSGREDDYAAFLTAIAVPRGDRMARLALEADPPDVAAAIEGFAIGQNDRPDLRGMVRLFRWFAWWPPFAAAVADWHVGDVLVGDMLGHGIALREAMQDGKLTPAWRDAVLATIAGIDAELTQRENTFTSHIGEAARGAALLVIIGLGTLIVAMWSLAALFAARLVRRQLAVDRELARSEARFRDFAEVGSDWYWECDGEHRLTYLSERYGAIVGPDRAQAAHGRLAGELIAAHGEPGEHQRYLDAITAQQPFRDLRLRYRGRDGSARFWSLSGKPCFVGGFLVGYRGIGSDITAEVQRAASLGEARDRAELANRAKSEFLANMSHELRTPLNAILGFSEVIGGQLFGPTAARYVDYARDIHHSGQHLLQIINDLLDLSKLEAGKLELHEEPVHLDKLLADCLLLIGARAAEAGVGLRPELAEGLPAVRADERLIKQVLLNLLSNAVKFTSRGGQVRIAAALVPEGVAIAVADTGIGMSAAEIEVALTPFGQVDSALTRKQQGTGLGLPLARSMTRLHGGTLEVASTPGQGTTVTVVLPASRLLIDAQFAAD